MADAEQLDTRLSKLLSEHQHYRKLLQNYIGRALSHCTWYIDEDSPSFLRQMDRAEKMIGLLWYIQNHADQSRYKLERSAQLPLSMADNFLTFSQNNGPATAGGGGGGGGGGTAAGAVGGEGSQRNGRANGTHGYHHHHHAHQHSYAPHSSHYHGQHHPPAPQQHHHHHQGPYDVHGKVAALTDDVRGVLRFWQDQSEIARLMEPKVIELERFARERSMDLSRKEATIEEKAGALRIANDQSRKVTEVLEVFLDQWFIHLQSNPSLPSTASLDHSRSLRDVGGGGSGSGQHVHTPGHP